MDKRSGEWKAFDLLKDKIKYKQSGETLRQSAIDSGKIEWNADLQNRIAKKLMSVSEVTPIVIQNPRKSLPVNSSNRIYSMNEQISSSYAADLNGDNIEDILLGGINGTVNAIDSKGNKLWAFSANGRVNEVSLQYAGNKALIFIATENWNVHTLDINGKELWNYKFPDDQPRREYKGNLIGITNVRIAHKNGKDQQPVIMVGTQYRYIYELDLDGKLKNETVLYYYGIEDMEYADLDADGKEEGIFALEYYYYTLVKDNELITGKTGGPGWKIADVLNDRVLKVEGYQIRNKAHYLAATAQGHLFKFSNMESTEESFLFPDEISNIMVEKGSSNSLIILGNGDVYRLK